MPPSNSSIYRVVILPLLVLLFVLQSQAKAQSKTQGLIKQMTRSGDYKVRLSAALNLAKSGNKSRAVINAFINRLEKDSNKTIRGVAAASLGKLVDSGTNAVLRNKAIAALQKASVSDSNSFVKMQAKKAYGSLKSLAGGSSSGGSGGGRVYINVSNMASKIGADPKLMRLMKRSTEKMFKKKTPSWTTRFPGGNPTASALKAKKMKAYHVHGTLTVLKETVQGSQTEVACKISMIVATYPKKSMFAFADGGAKVRGSSSPKQVQFAKEDCVAAVVESLVAQQIIPTLKMKAKTP